MVAAKANRLFPSISAWFPTSECNKTAAFSSTVSYASDPKTVARGLALADSRRPWSRTVAAA